MLRFARTAQALHVATSVNAMDLSYSDSDEDDLPDVEHAIQGDVLDYFVSWLDEEVS